MAAVSFFNANQEDFKELSKNLISSKFKSVTSIVKFNRAIEMSYSDSNKKYNVDEISLKIGNSKVIIEESPDELMHFDYPIYNNKSATNFFSENKLKIDFEEYFEGIEDHLVINWFNEGDFINITNDEATKIRLKVPKTIKKINIKTRSGDVFVKNISLDELNFNSISGNLKSENSAFKKIIYDNISGDLKFQGSLGSARVKTVSGHVKIYSINNKPELKIESISGDAKIYFEDQPSVDVDFVTTSGQIRVRNTEFTQRSNLPTQKFKLGKGEGQLGITTTSGDVLIKQLHSWDEK